MRQSRQVEGGGRVEAVMPGGGEGGQGDRVCVGIHTYDGYVHTVNFMHIHITKRYTVSPMVPMP